MTASDTVAAGLREERDQARKIVQDIHWMARRYADGRSTYAPDMFNRAVRPAFEAGWLSHNGATDEPQYARDGMFSAEYVSLEGRLQAETTTRLALEDKLAQTEQALGEARAKALEEAARYLEDLVVRRNAKKKRAGNDYICASASAIRALASKEPQPSAPAPNQKETPA